MAAAAFSRAGGGAPSHGGSWRQRLGAIVPGGRAAKSLLTAARIRRVTGRAVTEIEAGQEGSVAFWEQGAASMYTNEAIVKRAEARHDPGVLDILHTWWETARRSLLLGVGSPMEKRGKPISPRSIISRSPNPKSFAQRPKTAPRAADASLPAFKLPPLEAAPRNRWTSSSSVR